MAPQVSLPTATEAMQRAVDLAEAGNHVAARLWVAIAAELRAGSVPAPFLLRPADETQIIERHRCVNCRADIDRADGQWVHLPIGQRACPLPPGVDGTYYVAFPEGG